METTVLAEVGALGGATGSWSGVALASGDADGDGHAEVLVGQAGPDGVVALVASAGDGGLVQQWKGTGMQLGAAVAGGHDLDGDGLDDWLIGAPMDGTSGALGGAAWVVPGGTGAGSVRAGHRLYLNAYANAGAGVATLGDADGDGFDDVAVGAPGRDGWKSGSGAVYLVHGPITGNTRLSTGTVWFGATDQYIGRDVHGVGDLDGDGLADFAIAVPGADNRATDAGAVYLVYGGESDTRQGLYSAGGRVLGRLQGGYAGLAVASDDLDGDGYLDLVVGAPGEKDWRGSVYVVSGPVVGNTLLTNSLGARLTGHRAGDGFGTSVATDGGSVFVGAPDRSDGDGAVYLFAGPVSGVQRAHNALRVDGEAGESFGAELEVVPSQGWLVVGTPTAGTEQGGISLLELL